MKRILCVTLLLVAGCITDDNLIPMPETCNRASSIDIDYTPMLQQFEMDKMAYRQRKLELQQQEMQYEQERLEREIRLQEYGHAMGLHPW